MTTINSIGILGGTFDPVHMGHLILAQEVMQSAKLDKIVFIPSGMPPHKDNKKVTGSLHRLNMLSLAIKTNGAFGLSSIEIERHGYSYTCETLYQLKTMYKNGDLLYYIIGADNIFEIESWKNFAELFNLCGFMVVARPGFDKNSVLHKADELKSKYNAKIQVLDIPLIGISSSNIRDRVLNEKTIKYLVPERVEEYIYEYFLYR